MLKVFNFNATHVQNLIAILQAQLLCSGIDHNTIRNVLVGDIGLTPGVEHHADTVTPAFELLGQAKQKGIMIKQSDLNPIKVIGYQYTFRLSADAALLKMGYDTGFGEDNSMLYTKLANGAMLIQKLPRL